MNGNGNGGNITSVRCPPSNSQIAELTRGKTCFQLPGEKQKKEGS